MGDTPALFLEVTVTGSPVMYPFDETPTPIPGMDFVKVRILSTRSTILHGVRRVGTFSPAPPLREYRPTLRGRVSA